MNIRILPAITAALLTMAATVPDGLGAPLKISHLKCEGLDSPTWIDKHGDQPFFEYLCFTVPHFPIQALPEDIAAYKDRYQSGWDAIRKERYARQKNMGILSGELPPLEPDVLPRWNLTDAEMLSQIGNNELKSKSRTCGATA